jgi:hypothetical protein
MDSSNWSTTTWCVFFLEHFHNTSAVVTSHNLKWKSNFSNKRGHGFHTISRYPLFMRYTMPPVQNLTMGAIIHLWENSNNLARAAWSFPDYILLNKKIQKETRKKLNELDAFRLILDYNRYTLWWQFCRSNKLSNKNAYNGEQREHFSDLKNLIRIQHWFNPSLRPCFHTDNANDLCYSFLVPE